MEPDILKHDPESLAALQAAGLKPTDGTVAEGVEPAPPEEVAVEAEAPVAEEIPEVRPEPTPESEAEPEPINLELLPEEMREQIKDADPALQSLFMSQYNQNLQAQERIVAEKNKRKEDRAHLNQTLQSILAREQEATAPPAAPEPIPVQIADDGSQFIDPAQLQPAQPAPQAAPQPDLLQQQLVNTQTEKHPQAWERLQEAYREVLTKSQALGQALGLGGRKLSRQEIKSILSSQGVHEELSEKYGGLTLDDVLDAESAVMDPLNNAHHLDRVLTSYEPKWFPPQAEETAAEGATISKLPTDKPRSMRNTGTRPAAKNKAVMDKLMSLNPTQLLDMSVDQYNELREELVAEHPEYSSIPKRTF